MIYILQYKGTSFASRFIQGITWSRYSHSAIGNSDGWVIEAWEGGTTGVANCVSPWENHTPGTEIDVFAVGAILHGPDIWAAASTQVGKDYDRLSLLGFLPVVRHWWKDDPDAWFCSHLVAWAFKKGGIPLFSDRTPLYKISPGLIEYSPVPTYVGTIFNESQWEELLG